MKSELPRAMFAAIIGIAGGLRMVRRREDDEGDEGVLHRSSMGAWKLVLFIATIVGGLVAVVTFDGRLATQAASAVVEARVGPVEKRLDDHLAAMGPKSDMMMQYVAEQREFNRYAKRTLNALCRANPQASCPLDSP